MAIRDVRNLIAVLGQRGWSAPIEWSSLNVSA